MAQIDIERIINEYIGIPFGVTADVYKYGTTYGPPNVPPFEVKTVIDEPNHEFHIAAIQYGDCEDNGDLAPETWFICDFGGALAYVANQLGTSKNQYELTDRVDGLILNRLITTDSVKRASEYTWDRNRWSGKKREPYEPYVERAKEFGVPDYLPRQIPRDYVVGKDFVYSPPDAWWYYASRDRKGFRAKLYHILEAAESGTHAFQTWVGYILMNEVAMRKWKEVEPHVWIRQEYHSSRYKRGQFPC